MTTRQVRETPAGKSISAWIILKRKKWIATVHSHYSDGGNVTVNVFNHGASRSAEKLPFQAGRAGGHGYDKLTAALSGLEIDGHKLTNHCGMNRKPKDGGLWPRDYKAPKGWRLSNFVSKTWGGKNNEERVDLPTSKQGYSDCYREPGLDYLKAIGYEVIQAI